MFDYIEKIKERLLMFGYEANSSEDIAIDFCFEKVKSTIKNDCNVNDIPEGLQYIAIDMAVGEFLSMKKTFSPDDIAGLDLGNAVKQIQTGDTTVQFSYGQSDSEKLDSFINYLLTYGKDQFSAFRRVRW